MFSRVVALLLVTAIASAAELRELPSTARAALEPAIAAMIAAFNASEERERQAPRVQAAGPPEEPYLLRATYRRAEQRHEVIGMEAGANPVVTVRVRAAEFEKRATNVNGRDLQAELAKARLVQTPRGYLLDFLLRWTGSKWEQLGEPVAHPTLGVVGRESTTRLLDSRKVGGATER